ncbi:DUF1515 family protein [Ensifer adhaerens]|uniref:DUF1515 family protein n=1 Tax=Ensifer adhaerens TaxID=106592 RepID=UPI000DC525FF|nr:DUF1515 family protein [Ensifer adhaerens]RAR99273.1 uncharacterized protein DUF1515 [Ensifer adhaerens]
MNQLVDRVGHLEASAITIGEEVSEMKLVTDDVRRWKLRDRWLGVTGIAVRALGMSHAEAIRRIIFVVMGKGW